MYRPEGFDAEKILAEFGEITSFTKNVELIEAGADAMLEGLKKGLGCCDYHSTKESHYGRKGYFVFIPEEGE